jgi:hypothetical protein
MENQDKEIAITITDREAYILSLLAHGKEHSRKKFGVSGLSAKLYDQLSKAISTARMVSLNEDWAVAREETKLEPKPSPLQQPKYCYTHRIFGDCGLCKKTASPANLKKITTPEMASIRFREAGERRADKEMKRLQNNTDRIISEASKRLGESL